MCHAATRVTCWDDSMRIAPVVAAAPAIANLLLLGLLHERAATQRLQRAAALILLVVGLLKLAMPLFPVDALGTPATRSGQIHNVLGNLTFFMFPLAALLLFGPLARMGSRSAPACSVVLAVATVGGLVGNAVWGFGLV